MSDIVVLPGRTRGEVELRVNLGFSEAVYMAQRILEEAENTTFKWPEIIKRHD